MTSCTLAEGCSFPFHNIVVATDLTPSSKKPLRAALELARCHGGRVLLLHVVRHSWMRRSILFVPTRHSEEMATRAHQKALRQMEDFLRGEDVAGIDFLAEVLDGNPAQRILERAQEVEADLIVVGARPSHTMAGHLASHIFFEGVSATLRRTAERPVLLIR